jgi:hypothetical protein
LIQHSGAVDPRREERMMCRWLAHRSAGADSRCAVHAGAFADRPELALAAGRGDRDPVGGATDELPPVQSWPLAVHAQREQRGIKYPIQGTIATSDGKCLWVFRYSSEHKSRSLFFSRDVRTLQALYPDREVIQELSDDARVVVSEPIGDLPGAWIEVPEGSYGVVGDGEDRLVPFKAKLPPSAVATL